MVTIEVFPKSPQKAVLIESPTAGAFFVSESFPKRKVSDSNWCIQGYKPGDNEETLGDACTAGTFLGWYHSQEDALEALSFIMGEPVAL